MRVLIDNMKFNYDENNNITGANVEYKLAIIHGELKGNIEVDSNITRWSIADLNRHIHLKLMESM